MPTMVSAARIGVLLTGDASHPNYAAVREGLAALGRVEGKDIVIEARFAEGRLDRLPRLAAELAALPVDVIAAVGAVHCRAAQQAAPGIPVVFAVVVDRSVVHGSGRWTQLPQPRLRGRQSFVWVWAADSVWCGA